MFGGTKGSSIGALSVALAPSICNVWLSEKGAVNSVLSSATSSQWDCCWWEKALCFWPQAWPFANGNAQKCPKRHWSPRWHVLLWYIIQRFTFLPPMLASVTQVDFPEGSARFPLKPETNPANDPSHTWKPRLERWIPKAALPKHLVRRSAGLWVPLLNTKHNCFNATLSLTHSILISRCLLLWGTSMFFKSFSALSLSEYKTPGIFGSPISLKVKRTLPITFPKEAISCATHWSAWSSLSIDESETSCWWRDNVLRVAHPKVSTPPETPLLPVLFIGAWDASEKATMWGVWKTSLLKTSESWGSFRTTFMSPFRYRSKDRIASSVWLEGELCWVANRDTYALMSCLVWDNQATFPNPLRNLLWASALSGVTLSVGLSKITVRSGGAFDAVLTP